MSNGVASSTTYGSRSSHTHNGLGKGFPPPPQGPETPGGPAYLTLNESDLNSPQPHGSTGSNGGYAYSTTLRRQASADHFQILGSGRAASPHASSSGGKRRTGSGGEVNGDNPYAYRHTPAEGVRGRSEEPGLVDRVMRAGRRLIGAQNGYEEVIDLGEEAAVRAEGERRMKETPSAIYAHKGIEVGYISPPLSCERSEELII